MQSRRPARARTAEDQPSNRTASDDLGDAATASTGRQRWSGRQGGGQLQNYVGADRTRDRTRVGGDGILQLSRGNGLRPPAYFSSPASWSPDGHYRRIAVRPDDRPLYPRRARTDVRTPRGNGRC